MAGPLKNKDPDEELEVYIQAYEPTLPHAAETGAIAEVDLHCFMTMPFKGLKVFSIKYSDGTTKRVAQIPMIGPWGSLSKYGCFGDGAAKANAIRRAYVMENTAWQEDR